MVCYKLHRVILCSWKSHSSEMALVEDPCDQLGLHMTSHVSSWDPQCVHFQIHLHLTYVVNRAVAKLTVLVERDIPKEILQFCLDSRPLNHHPNSKAHLLRSNLHSENLCIQQLSIELSSSSFTQEDNLIILIIKNCSANYSVPRCLTPGCILNAHSAINNEPRQLRIEMVMASYCKSLGQIQ